MKRSKTYVLNHPERARQQLASDVELLLRSRFPLVTLNVPYETTLRIARRRLAVANRSRILAHPALCRRQLTGWAAEPGVGRPNRTGIIR
jgi:hypothetical protein